MDSLLGWIILVLVILYALYALAVVAKYMRIWRSVRLAGSAMSLRELIAMQRRKVNPRVIIEALTLANQAGLDLSIQQLERHYSHGGRVVQVVEALSLAKSEKIKSNWHDLCHRDLEGKNVIEFMKKRIEELDRGTKRRSRR